jgi:hypothetical protein
VCVCELFFVALLVVGVGVGRSRANISVRVRAGVISDKVQGETQVLYLPASREAPSCILMWCVSCALPRARLLSFVAAVSPLLLLVLPLLRWSCAFCLRLQLQKG